MNPVRFKNINLLLVFMLCLNTNTLHAQQKFTDNLSIQANYHIGYILPEYQFVNYLANDYIRSFDVSLIKQTRGKSYWEQVFNYPQYGLSFFYSSLSNNEVFGKEFALNYFFKVNIIDKKKFRLYNRTGIGIGYVSKKFDLETNPNNVATGSNSNIHFNLRMGVNYSLTQRTSFNLGLSFDHFSNANTSEPNLGLNYVTAFGGINYKIGSESELLSYNIEPHKQKNNLKFFANIGGKHTRALASEYFLTSSFEFEFQRELTRVFHLGLGVDLFYDSSVKTQLTDMQQEFKNRQSFQTGIHISQSFAYNKFSITLQEGLYFLLPNEIINKRMYNRAIAQYWLTDHIGIRLSMKSHVFILDYPELGIGFKL